MNEYPELKEIQDYADKGEKIDVQFSKPGKSGIYSVTVTVGGRCLMGPRYFSFDKKRIFNFWTDYPGKLTPEQIKKFNEWNKTLAALKNYGGYPPNKDEQARDLVPSDVWNTRFNNKK